MDYDKRQEYMEDRNFTVRQVNYVNLLSAVFNIHNSRGDIFPYEPEGYQIDYHADCMVANPQYPNRIWEKARGVGASATTMMDALMVGHRYNGVNIPVASITGAQSDGPVDWAIWLADNPQIPGYFVRDKSINSKCILDNKSTIFAVPGQNPDALRSFRTIFNIYDEFAFHAYPDKLKTAGDACLSEGGQINILSTLNGTENTFYDILANATDLGYKVYEVPMFDSAVFDVDRNIFDQIDEGLITPISPWVNLQKLEDSRRFDKVAFMQEQMCSAQDGAVSFLPSALLHKCSRLPYQIEQQERSGWGIYVCGIDFASENDNSAFQIYELTPHGWIHRKRVLVSKTDTVQQNRILRELHADFNFKYVTIDMTGSGTGFYHYARDQLRTTVIGINFSSRHQVEEKDAHLYRAKDSIAKKNGKVSIPIKRAMATYFKMEMEKDRCVVLDYKDYLDDLHSVVYETLDAPRKHEKHGDEFWGSCLALWGYYISQMQITARPYVARY